MIDERLYCVREAVKRLTRDIINKDWEHQDTSTERTELNRLLKLESQGVVYEPKH